MPLVNHVPHALIGRDPRPRRVERAEHDPTTPEPPPHRCHWQTGSPADGVITRHQIARVLLDSLETDQAINTTFELIAEPGDEQHDLNEDFKRLDKDSDIDKVYDQSTLPLNNEPEAIHQHLQTITPPA